jgi:hypothetical protein
MSDLFMRRTAIISECGRYRYRLTREWGDGPLLTFAMLNPSTANAEIDDPTIRRCMSFGRREGASGISVFNLFAQPTPRGLLAHMTQSVQIISMR